MTPRKTAVQISDQIIAALEAQLNTTVPLFPKAMNRLLAKVIAGVFVILFQLSDFIALQIFVKYASNKEMTIGGVPITPLKEWGALVDIWQKEGTRATRTIQIQVLTQGGALTSGTQVVNPETGLLYLTLGDVALDASLVYAQIQAVEAGEAWNVDYGTPLAFVSAPPTLTKTVYVSAIGAQGVEPETTEAFRERILERFAARPQGGAYADYRDWAEAIPGVKHAYPYSGWKDDAIPASTSGQGFVYIESEADVDGIPAALPNAGRPGDPPGDTLLDQVFAYIEADTDGIARRRNINTYVRVFPISRKTYDVVVYSLHGVADPTEVLAKIQSGLNDYFLARAPYINGLTVLPRRDIVSNVTVGGIAARIAAAHGGSISGVAVTSSGLDVGVDYLQEGQKAKIGTLAAA